MFLILVILLKIHSAYALKTVKMENKMKIRFNKSKFKFICNKNKYGGRKRIDKFSLIYLY